MPFRQLPNSDPTRIAALNAAHAKWTATPAAERAFPQPVFDRLDPLRTQFKTESGEAGSALSAQVQASDAATLAQLALGQLVSHFIQVFNFAVARRVFAPADRAHYGLPVNNDILPPLATRGEIVTWAGALIAGEAARTAAGGAPMAMPAIGDVQAALTAFNTARNSQSERKDDYDDEQADVQALRPDVDKVIRDIWDHVEFTYRDQDNPSQRRKAREWGVVYVPRAGEEPEEEPATPPTEPPTP